MKATLRRQLAILAILQIGMTACASAQANPDSVKHRNDCRLATQVLEKGQPANRRNWAIGFVKQCLDAESKTAILAALAAARQSAEVGSTVGLLMIVRDVQDGDYFDAIVAIAGDHSASVPSRVGAFMALVELLNPSLSTDYQKFVSANPSNPAFRGGCAARVDHPVVPVPGLRPMPANFRQTIASIVNRVRDDASEPQAVRSAAACAS